jgi:hypothetical protein
MQLKRLRKEQDSLVWPQDSNELPVISWDAFQQQAQSRPLILISGFIHDVSGFLDEHPGGRHLLAKNIGKDATTAFFGGVYDHSNAAHNVSTSQLNSNDHSLTYSSALSYETRRDFDGWCSVAVRVRPRAIQARHTSFTEVASVSCGGDGESLEQRSQRFRTRFTWMNTLFESILEHKLLTFHEQQTNLTHVLHIINVIE